MKKLNDKLFITLFTILSLFVLTILIIFNTQNYVSERRNIINNLNRIVKNDRFDKDMIPKDNRVFMDLDIYTIVLDDNNDISDIINQSFDKKNSDNINDYVENIKNSNNNYYIGNLYFSNYSYKYYGNKYIILIDNSNIKDKLCNMIYLSIVILLVSEAIIFIISSKLTKKLTAPAIESFEKQKQFIADASHELKTPLAVIMASADNAIKNKNETKWINNIQSESERMNKLITNLLDLSKIENNNSDTFEEIDLSKLVEKSILTLESLIYEKNIKLDYNIEDNIKFNCNSDEIKQLLSILLDNAIKHSIEEGKIDIKLYSENNRLNLIIKNKGNPIPKGEEEKIFERFYRIDKSRNRNDNRYGLGLAIAKSIVIKHNGLISASSTDSYTTFKVVFRKK